MDKRTSPFGTTLPKESRRRHDVTDMLDVRNRVCKRLR
jgi:hypothetical protein